MFFGPGKLYFILSIEHRPATSVQDSFRLLRQVKGKMPENGDESHLSSARGVGGCNIKNSKARMSGNFCRHQAASSLQISMAGKIHKAPRALVPDEAQA
jgi:hypothetical protein